MQPLKIGIVSRWQDPKRGGHENYLNRLTGSLLEHGHSVTHFANRFEPEKDRPAGARYIHVPMLRFPQFLRYISFNRNAKKIVDNYRDELDVIFSTEYVSFGDVYRAGAGIQRAEMKARGGWYSWLNPKNLTKVLLQDRLFATPPKLIIANSKILANQIISEYEIQPEQIEIIYNGVDTARYNSKQIDKYRNSIRKDLAIPDDSLLLITLGSNIKRKGIDNAIEIQKKLNVLLKESNSSFKNSHLLLVGGMDFKRLKKEHKIQQDDNIHYLGFKKNPIPYYAASDFCLVLSRYDPAPNTALESLALGIPVVITQTTGWSTIVKNNSAGKVIKNEENNIITDFLKNITNQELNQLKKNAANIGKNYSLERHCEALLNSIRTRI